jgi:hypothetical protein
MCRDRVGPHTGPMFNSYDIERALVVERQSQFLREARQNRLARRARKARRTPNEERPAA